MTPDDDEQFTDAQLAMLDQGIRGLGLIDALAAALLQSLIRYKDEAWVAPSGSGLAGVVHDSIELVEAWQALAASPFGAMFDPRVTEPDGSSDGS